MHVQLTVKGLELSKGEKGRCQRKIERERVRQRVGEQEREV